MTDEIHSCSYYCDRPACIKAQRDELVRKCVETKEKAEPVAVIGPVWQILWCDSESIAAIAKKHGLKVGDKLYTTPPAERVRVPFPMAESNAPDHLGPDEKQTYADGFNACRELVLSAAPEADHD